MGKDNDDFKIRGNGLNYAAFHPNAPVKNKKLYNALFGEPEKETVIENRDLTLDDVFGKPTDPKGLF